MQLLQSKHIVCLTIVTRSFYVGIKPDRVYIHSMKMKKQEKENGIKKRYCTDGAAIHCMYFGVYCSLKIYDFGHCSLECVYLTFLMRSFLSRFLFWIPWVFLFGHFIYILFYGSKIIGTSLGFFALNKHKISSCMQQPKCKNIHSQHHFCSSFFFYCKLLHFLFGL